MSLKIEQQDDGKHGVLLAKEADTQAGEMTYTWAGDTLFIIDHTDVSDDYRGQGVGRQLLDKAVSFAREKQVKILPLCPYAKSVFDKDSSIHDVLHHS